MSHGHACPEHRRRLRECDAADVVQELLTEVRAGQHQLRLWLLPDGEFTVTADGGLAYQKLHARSPLSLVGVFWRTNSRAEVLDAVWTRAAAIGMEWNR